MSLWAGSDAGSARRAPATACFASSARVAGPSSFHCRRRSAAPSPMRSATGPAVRSCSTTVASGWTGTPPPAASGRWRRTQGCECHRSIHTLRHTHVTAMLDPGVDVQIAARHADPGTTMRYDRARNQLDRHPNYILAAYMASGT
jgi:hypothetical protein